MEFKPIGNLERTLIQLLKERGPNDPETKKILIQWTIEQEQIVEKSADYKLGQIYLNVYRARLYLKAGYKEEALENFQAAQTQAWNEHRDELHKEISEEIKKLETQ